MLHSQEVGRGGTGHSPQQRTLSLSKHERPNGLRQAQPERSCISVRGFTLLELLVALVIASIMLSMAALRLMPSAQTVLRDEAQRLALLTENGAMASQAGGQPLAWSGTGSSYRFWTRTKEGEWIRIERDALLHPRTLPEAVHIGDVSFNGRRVEPGSLVMLSPELAAKDFRISLVSGDLISDVVGNGLGKVEVVAGKTP